MELNLLTNASAFISGSKRPNEIICKKGISSASGLHATSIACATAQSALCSAFLLSPVNVVGESEEWHPLKTVSAVNGVLLDKVSYDILRTVVTSKRHQYPGSEIPLFPVVVDGQNIVEFVFRHSLTPQVFSGIVKLELKRPIPVTDRDVKVLSP